MSMMMMMMMIMMTTTMMMMIISIIIHASIHLSIGYSGPVFHPEIFIFPFPAHRLPISPERGLFFDHSQVLLPRYDPQKRSRGSEVASSYNKFSSSCSSSSSSSSSSNGNRSSIGSNNGNDDITVDVINEGVIPLTLHPCKEGLYIHPDSVLDLLEKKCHYDYAKVLTIDPITGNYQ
jgi:hypothetical protein